MTKFAIGACPLRSMRESANGATTSSTRTSGIRWSRKRCDCCAPKCGRSANDARLARISGALVADADLDEPTLVVHARLVVAGIDGVRLHEELFGASGRFSTSGFARLNVGETRRAMKAKRVGALPRHHHVALVDLWPRITGAVSAAVDARMRARIVARAAFQERGEREAAALRAVLDELRGSIERELDRVELREAEQLRLFDTAREIERRQFARDVESRRQRIASIPAEADREAERLIRRYESPRAIVFPAAVESLVPRHLGGNALFAK